METHLVERKFVVFVCSTYEDLKEHRRQVINAILTLNHVPIGMEFFPPQDRTKQYIEKQIEASDILLLIFGGKLGTAMKANDPLTFIQYEYECAKTHKKEIIILLQDEGDFEKHKHARDITLFRKTLERSGGTVGYFAESHPEKSGAAAMSGLQAATRAMERRPRPGGWVPAHEYDRIKDSLIVGLRDSQSAFIQRYVAFLAKIDTINTRALSRKPAKEAIGRYLWKYFMTSFAREGVHKIFFESGSSTAYASYFLLEYIRENFDWFLESKMNEQLTIVTNNLFTFLDLTLYTRQARLIQDIVLYPTGPFWPKYAATYGKLVAAGNENPDLFRDEKWKLSKEATDACVEVSNEIDRKLGPKGLIVMAVSGMEWEKAWVLGPHAGSYHNGLMKRGLIRSRHAKMIILDNNKWAKGFDFDRCFPVCGGGVDWLDIIETAPIAFAIGSDSESDADQIETDLKERHFTVVKEKDGDCVSIVAYNRSFDVWRASDVPVHGG